MRLAISAVSIGERTREDLGDISELAASIEALGLLHPIVVTASHDLVAGERRLAAIRSLGWVDVPVTIAGIENAADVLRAELEENTCRKSLSAYEADVLRQKRERVLAEDAKRRQRLHGSTAPGRSADKAEPGGDRLPGMPSENTSANLAEVSRPAERETRKVAAIGTGYSGSTLDKVRKIRDAAERGVIKHGRTEVPAPEPVRQAAKAAVEEIKKTGAAVNRASASVDSAIEKHAPAMKAKEALASWRSKFQGAIKRIGRVFGDFDVEQAARNADDELLAELRQAHADLGNYIDRVEALRPKDATILQFAQGGDR